MGILGPNSHNFGHRQIFLVCRSKFSLIETPCIYISCLPSYMAACIMHMSTFLYCLHAYMCAWLHLVMPACLYICMSKCLPAFMAACIMHICLPKSQTDRLTPKWKHLRDLFQEDRQTPKWKHRSPFWTYIHTPKWKQRSPFHNRHTPKCKQGKLFHGTSNN